MTAEPMVETVTTRARQEKIDRLKSGKKPRVLDLFAGCGGFSLGFRSAGFEIAGGVEKNDYAATTHAQNFFRGEGKKVINHHATGRDIRETEPGDVLTTVAGKSSVASKIDVIVGGPPCQSYARVGRAKLREVDKHPEAFLEDNRGNLYLRYLHYVRALEPLAVVLENVPDSLNYGGHNVAEEIAEVLSDREYRCAYTLLNSAFYQVPQMRERMFLIAYAEELESEVEFPSPSHHIDLPSGYYGSRSVALKLVRDESLLKDKGKGHFVPAPPSSNELPDAITAKEALDDLPPITRHLEGNLKRGPRRFNRLDPYPEMTSLTPYARLMRNWPDFENKKGIYDHAIRNLPRDFPIFQRMEPGDQYPEAHEKAKQMLRERIEKERRAGNPIPEDSDEYEKMKSDIVPPYDPEKFPNKWRKMEPDAPARTLMAHLGKDSYSHIHYDSKQARTISVREAARLQSFPDGFNFAGTMNPAFRQIGNAVPPLLAHAIALEVASALSVSKKNVTASMELCDDVSADEA